MKKAVILFAVLASFLVLTMGNVFKAGTDHVEAVEQVVTLKEKNEMLTLVNETLYTEVVKLKIVVDTLTVFKDSLLGSVLESNQKQNINKDDYEKSSVTNYSVYADEPYSFSIPIEIETEETEVSSSPN